MMTIKRKIIVFLFFLFASFAVYGSPVVKLVMENEIFKFGDLVKVKVLVEDNPGIHGLYFDLKYDSSILTFDYFEKGLMVLREPKKNNFFYALSDSITAGIEGDHIIGSYGLTADNATTNETGILAEIYFRVTGVGVVDQAYSFTFDHSEAVDGLDNEIPEAIWQNSDNFYVGTPSLNAYVLINDPVGKTVVWTDYVDVSGICSTTGASYLKFENTAASYTSGQMDPSSGSFTSVPVPLAVGMNTVTALLYDAGDNVIATDKLSVYRSDDTEVIKILTPLDHSLMNTDYVTVKVASKYTGVMVGKEETSPAETYNDIPVYSTELKLKQGFNTITAAVSGPAPDYEVYTHSIAVYFNADDRAFKIITPFEGMTYAKEALDNIVINGEVSTKDQTTIILEAWYHPKNSYEKSSKLFTKEFSWEEDKDDTNDIREYNGELEVTVPDTETPTPMPTPDPAATPTPAGPPTPTPTPAPYVQAPYIFSYTPDADSFKFVSNGRIEFIAYKNKKLGVAEQETHSIIYVDDSELRIDLVQPHVYGQDLFELEAHLEAFQGENEYLLTNVVLEESRFHLAADNRTVTQETFFANVEITDMIEDNQGVLYALVNDNYKMSVYKKAPEDDGWIQVVTNAAKFGYDLCATDLGVLVGVTNTETSEDSGLYLLVEENDDYSFVNITIGEPIPHVQFIENNNGIISLYGNGYSHLYSFSIYSLEGDNISRSTQLVTKVPFYNNLFMDQLVFSDNHKIAALLTTMGEIQFYQNKEGLGFFPTQINHTALAPGNSGFNRILYGVFEDGAYNIFLLLSENDAAAYSVMEEKRSSRLIVNQVDLAYFDETLIGGAFEEDEFAFIYYNADAATEGYRLRRAGILFDRANFTPALSLDAGGNPLEYINYGTPTKNNISDPSAVIAGRFGSYFFGFGNGTAAPGVYELVREYSDTGSAQFYYDNSDVKGLRGFRFSVDSPWLESDSAVLLDFTVTSANGNVSMDDALSLQAFTEPGKEFPDFSVRTENAGDGIETVVVTFDDLQKESSIQFDLTFAVQQNISPEIFDFAVDKKVAVKMPDSKEALILPIFGYVYDPTVEVVKISGTDDTISIGRDRSFSYNYPVPQTKQDESFSVTLSAINSALVETEVFFEVAVFKSLAGFTGIPSLIDPEPTPSGPPAPLSFTQGGSATVEGDTIRVSGNYFGLVGAVVGYELHDGTETVFSENTLIKKGVLETSVDLVLADLSDQQKKDILVASDDDIIDINAITEEDLITRLAHFDRPGYESGSFANAEIKLVPGMQTLLLFVENPGGLKSYYLQGTNEDKYPVINYNLPLEDQKITVTNVDITDMDSVEYTEMVPIEKSLEVEIFEQKIGSGATALYQFKRTLYITGNIVSVKPFQDLKIKSFSDDVTFEGGLTEKILTLGADIDNRSNFSFKVDILMAEDTAAENYDIALIPTSPFLERMKTGIRIKAVKNYSGAYLKPDFSPMDPQQNPWSSEEYASGSKDIRIQFSRFVPSGTTINMTLNFDKTISGTLEEITTGSKLYKVVSDHEVQALSDVRSGWNRIQWELLQAGGNKIASSKWVGTDMEDFLFLYPDVSEYTPTAVTFNIFLQKYYNSGDMETFTVTKDVRTYAKIALNGQTLWEDNGEADTYTISDWSDTGIVEGKNLLAFSYKEDDENSPLNTVEYPFLFDSLAPEANILSYEYDEALYKLVSLSAVVKEKNLKKVLLTYEKEGGAINIVPDSVTFLVNDMFEVRWDSLGDETTDIRPDADHRVFIEAVDHAGNPSNSGYFSGITLTPSAQPVKELPRFIPVKDYAAGNDPAFEDEPADGGFTEHQKFYNNDYPFWKYQVQNGETFNIEGDRNVSIGAASVSGEFDSPLFHINDGGKVFARAEGKIHLKPGFTVFQGGFFQSSQQGFEDYSTSGVTHDKDSNFISFGFFFRNEQKAYFAPDGEYRRILTIYNEGNHSVYLAFKNTTPGIPGGEQLYVIDNDNGAETVLIGETTPVKVPQSSPELWHPVVLSVSKYSLKEIRLSVSGHAEVQAALNNSTILDDILSASGHYYFGDTDQSASGFFSIARPFYINELINIDELSNGILGVSSGDGEIAAVEGYNALIDSPKRFYAFDNDGSDLTTDPDASYYQLKAEGDPGGDAFVTTENATFSTEGSGSLKGSDLHLNYLKVENSSIIFHDSPGPRTVNIDTGFSYDTDLEKDVFTLSPPVDVVGDSIYIFSSLLGNHGLSEDRWYSIAGEVLNSDSEKVDAELVLKIDGTQKVYPFKQGKFHFIFPYNTAEAPESVVMYIRVRSPLKLGTDLVMNAGNYTLPLNGVDKYEKTWAVNGYAFHPEGTVEFWYKPFNSNPQGYVNYDTVILDSELIKIGAKRTGTASEATFYGVLKGCNGGSDFELQSNVPVTGDWQHLQFSYSIPEQLISFYINGELVGLQEDVSGNPWYVHGTMAGDPAVDNLFIGAELGHRVFAEGFIDEIRLSHYYNDSLFTSKEPMTFSYTDSDENSQPALAVDLSVSSSSITDVLFILESRDGSYHKVARHASIPTGDKIFVTDNQDDIIPGLQSGAYTLYGYMKIGDYNYRSLFSFIKDDKPSFKRESVTPFILSKVNSNIKFRFNYNDSYLLYDNSSRWAALGIKLSWTNDSGDFNKILFVSQDYRTMDESGRDQWIVTGELDVNTGYRDWAVLPVNSKSLEVIFPGVTATEDIIWDIRPFYFDGTFPDAIDFGGVPDDKFSTRFDTYAENSETGLVEKAELDVIPFDPANIEYKLMIQVGDDMSTLEETFIQDLSIGWYITQPGNLDFTPITGEQALPSGGKLELFYDDLLLGQPFGEYKCIISLMYKGHVYPSEEKIINWEDTRIQEDPYELSSAYEKQLVITDFSLIHLADDTAKIYLEYATNNLDSTVTYDIVVTDMNTGESSTEKTDETLLKTENFIITEVPVPQSSFHVGLTVNALDDGLRRKADFTGVNSAQAPEIFLTNTVPSQISYNNVTFSWKGTMDGVSDSEIKYTYNFDEKGWSAAQNWNEVSFYNLDEGSHTFKVQALNADESSRSAIEKVVFFVDIHKPEFNEDYINIEEIVRTEGIIDSVKISGSAGAVEDISFSALTINGVAAEVFSDGSFSTVELSLANDGVNNITFTAYDMVGNVSEYVHSVDNNLTQIFYPTFENTVKYSPVTLYGKIGGAINSPLEIYIADGRTVKGAAGDYSRWKKGRINEDRGFFVEDIYISPGTSAREAVTVLEMAVVTETGRVFTKNIPLKANELFVPIDVVLNTHAIEGDSGEREITFDCAANVDDIVSWSIDFTGDGIYDLVDIMDSNTDYKTHSWSHTYSTLGEKKPRIRVITADGHYFSVATSVIIHEKIKEASHKLINEPISMSTLKMPDNSQRLFVLAGSGVTHRIEVYEVGRNENYISDRLYTISLDGMAIENPVAIKALDADTIIVGYNRNREGFAVILQADGYGNFKRKAESTSTTYPIVSMDADASTLYMACGDEEYVANVEDRHMAMATLPLTNPEPDEVTGLIEQTFDKLDPVIKGTKLHEIIPTTRYSLVRDGGGLLLADYYYQTIIRMTTEGFDVPNYYGGYGTGEGKFLTPALIESYGDNIFVYDDTRRDIQVFDAGFNLITTLKYDPAAGADNYLEPDFLVELADIAAITREEGSALYYYALLLSKTNDKLAMVKLPRWKELEAKKRNNKMVFLKDREVFTAKPNGSDLTRILTTDSLPRIEGTLDYPALSPDGKRIVFTSRVELYDRTGETGIEGNEYAHDNLYVMNTDGSDLTRIPLGTIDTYEIERPVFNSNGDRVIFSAKPTGGSWQIYIYHFATGGISRLFESQENVRFPFYSPDDRFVAFSTDYDGDEDIEIVDTENTSVRVTLTNNNSRDSLPVWSVVYPGEIKIPDTDIESKIAIVSERNGHKGVHYLYVSRPSDSDIRIVTADETETGNDPDSAALEITSASEEGDYPAFTGDGTSLVFEHFDGLTMKLLRKDFESPEGTPNSVINLPEGARKPSGMKNMISGFNAESVGGDNVQLSWTPYTDNEIFYTVRFMKANSTDPFVQKKIFTKGDALIKGLEMSTTYLFKVSIMENDEETAATLWKEVKMPEVAARASYEIDEVNPYLVHLNAWKPTEETKWEYNWVIDNQEIVVQSSQDFMYEFATSGSKTIFLKAFTMGKEDTSVSEPLTVDIISDIRPVVEYKLAEDGSYIELNAKNSLGTKIDWAASTWTITGPGRMPLGPIAGSQIIVPLDGFLHKINVTLTLRRIMVNGQGSTDMIEKNVVIDLDFKDVKPVITYEEDLAAPGLFHFTGQNSLGNIDWLRARWTILGDGVELHRADAASSVSYKFPESSRETLYSVTLTVPRRNDGMTETATQIISVASAPVEPVIDYEVLTLTEGGNDTGAKILFSCGNSMGSSIDFNNARWTVPLAGSYGEQPSQVGPTAVYNLVNIENDALIEVSLTLSRRGGGDPVTVTKVVRINAGEVPKVTPAVTIEKEVTNNGTALIFDALKTTGPNIEWEKTEWLFDGQYSRRGPVARYELPYSVEKQTVQWVCTIYPTGGTPILERGHFGVDETNIEPFIDAEKRGENVYELNVLKTAGAGIDWEKTLWYIYDGNENVVIKQGPAITHAFALKSEALGYPVMVEMFLKGSSKPVVGYKTIDVEGDEFTPIITWDNGSDENVVNFTAQKSIGSNIDWSQARWTFGDSSEAQYGPSAVHKYNFDAGTKTYRASLTLTRRSANGSMETKTAFVDVDIDADDVKPRIRARLRDNGFLTLSAEESQGRGLMLDRSSWLFEGEGDNTSFSRSRQAERWNTSVSASWAWVPFVKMAELSVSVGASGQMGTDNSENFSSSNIHTGAVCRKNVEDIFDLYNTRDWESDQTDFSRKNLGVTLFVYRMGADGTLVGESITTQIDLTDTQITSDNGVLYDTHKIK